jgi:hypothetical protein
MSRPLDVRSVAIGALIVSLTVGLASNVLFLIAFQFRIDWFLDPPKMIGAGPTSAELLRWAAVLDLIGYYLATGALAYALWRLLRRRDPVVADLSALAAIGYTIAGGAAAAVLAMVGPMLMQSHGSASGLEQATIESQFAMLFEGVWRSVWQVFDGILLAAWWLGIGRLVRGDQPILSAISLALAAVAVLGVFLTIIGVDLGRDVALGLVFSLWTAWWIVLLLAFLGDRAPFGRERGTASVDA